MPRCPTITFQVAKVPKTLAKHNSTKVSFKFTPRTEIFTLTYIYVEYEDSITSCHIWNIDGRK